VSENPAGNVFAAMMIPIVIGLLYLFFLGILLPYFVYQIKKSTDLGLEELKKIRSALLAANGRPKSQ
jgi:hypothetical protein